MSTAAQILANQKNAQASTGPVTPEGKANSARNATKHGLTGLTLVISPAEADAYHAHVASYMSHHEVTDHQHRLLIQQVADLDWSIHQVFVLQTNTMNLFSTISIQMADSGDPIATAKALAPVARTLATLSTYEGRRRRAMKTAREELAAFEEALAEKAAEERHNSLKMKANPENGFVHSALPQAKTVEQILAETDAFIASLEAQETPKMVAKLRREAEMLGKKR